MGGAADVLYLRAYAPTDIADDAVRALGEIPDVLHVIRQGTVDGRTVLISADLPATRVDAALEAMLGLGLPTTEVSVERASLIGPAERPGRWFAHREDAMVWAEIVEGAREHARLPLRYLTFMAVAGVIAGLAVVLRNSVLIVGAMAISPDLLPVTAACVAIVGRRPRLLARSAGTLAIGLVIAVFFASLTTRLLESVGFLWSEALPTGTSLILPPTVQAPTVIVAFAAGVAGMIATETRASAAVGVAISVTTIPAAAYIGVALAIDAGDEALGALGVLAVNVIMLVVGGTASLIVQRWTRSRSSSV
jgi:uncharacterized hydrophobic protein (TIGR00271 family)